MYFWNAVKNLFKLQLLKGINSASFSGIIVLLVATQLIMTQSAIAEPQEASLAASLSKQRQSYKRNPVQGAEVILRKSRIELDQSRLAKATVYLSVAINNDEAARDYSQINIPFNSYYETLQLDFARVLTSDGTLESVLNDAIQIQSPAQDNFYQDRKELTFSLPNVRPGSTIEFQYTRQDTSNIMTNAYFGRFWLHWWQGRAAGQGARLDPVLTREITLKGPESLDLSIAISHPEWVKQSVSRNNGLRVWQWTASNLPVIPLQPFMPREDGLEPYISVSTEKGWSSVSNWASQLFKPHLKINIQLKKEADKIAASELTIDAKVRAVYQLINKQVRYVFAHVGRGGYEPHSAGEVFKNGYGDCKDQTVLAVVLLRELGIEAYPALVATRAMGRPNLPVPGVYFDHMITYIPAQAGTPEIWLDTTGDQQLFPGGGISIEGQPALIIQANTKNLTEIPNKPLSEHFAKLNIIFETPSKKSANQHLKAIFKLELGGVFEQSLRSTWIYQAEKEKALSDSIANLFSNAEIKEIDVNDSSDLWQPFGFTGTWEFKTPWHPDEPELVSFNLIQMLGVFTGIYQWHKPEERNQPFQIDPGYVLEANILFKQSTGSDFQELISSGPNINNPWFTLTQQQQVVSNGIQVITKFIMRRLTLNQKEYINFYNTLMDLRQEQGFIVAYNDTRGQPKKNNTEQGVSAMFSAVRSNIADGKFTDALDVAQRAAQLAPRNGEAQYLLGLAQGYNGLLDEASQSFDLAKSLGYENL